MIQYNRGGREASGAAERNDEMENDKRLDEIQAICDRLYVLDERIFVLLCRERDSEQPNKERLDKLQAALDAIVETAACLEDAAEI